MNDDKVTQEMIDFIKEKENAIVSAKMTGDSKAKGDVVKAIIDELVKKVPNED